MSLEGRPYLGQKTTNLENLSNNIQDLSNNIRVNIHRLINQTLNCRDIIQRIFELDLYRIPGDD